MKVLFLLVLTVPALGQVSITQQAADQAAIPNSTRSLYANIQGTSNLTVNWKVTGGCTLGSSTTTAAPQTVTAPPNGGSCTYVSKAPTNEAPSFRSATSCTVTAVSAADESKTASIIIPVCAPAVSLTVFPVNTVLYKNQFAVIQSDLRGSVDTGVTWAITANPGEAGSFAGGSSNRHAVFSAKAPGAYVVTATSVADKSKTSSATINVTDHDPPPANADHTESVDCTAVGGGKTYDVGPGRALVDLNAVPWNGLRAGDTVRIHNDDTTGSAPTEYHQDISIGSTGSAKAPLRICGVPDAKGVKPIIDGSNAKSRNDANWAGGSLEGLGVITLYDPVHRMDAIADANQNIVIEGLHIRNASLDFKYLKQSNAASTQYIRAAACIRVQTGRQVLLRGNELESCSQGIFANAQTPLGEIVSDLTVQGNYIHNWGGPNNDHVHAVYLQAIGLQVQFNYFGPSVPGAPGNIIKSRSVLNFLRWNYFSQLPTTARVFDLVEPEAFNCYVIPYEFAAVYHGEGMKTDCNTPHLGSKEDPYTADEVAANFETYHSDYVYGNVMDDGGGQSAFVHYGYDEQIPESPAYDRRGGTLYYWNNTHLFRKSTGLKPIFDALAPDQGKSYEFPKIESINNVFGSSGNTTFMWTRPFWSEVIVDSNWMYPGYTLPSRNAADTYQGAATATELAKCDQWGHCPESNGHLIWARNGKRGAAAASLYIGPTPFDTITFLPNNKIHGLAAQLPKAIQDQPSNMEYFPATNTIAPRQDASSLGALD